MKIKDTILPMSQDLFTLRRKAIGFLYEAKKIVGGNQPRITVRIAEMRDGDGCEILGTSYGDAKFITISKDMAKWNNDQIRFVVWHELGHAWFNAPHIEGDALMCPKLPKKFNWALQAEALIKLAGGK